VKEEVRIYEPDNSIRKGRLSVLAEIVGEIVSNRWLTYQLFKRDFLALYKQSMIGVFWALIIPLVSLGAFLLLRGSGVFHTGDIRVPYPIYAVAGISLWQLFSSGLVTSAGSLVEAGQMVKIISFSKKSLVIAAIGRSVVSFCVQLVLLGALFVAFARIPHWTILLMPLFVLPLILLTIGLGFILSLVNAVMRDVGTGLAVILSFLMFLTPVLYAEPQSGALAVITKWNPLYYLVSSPREMILEGRMLHPEGYAWAVAFSVLTFVAGAIIFHLTETKITERV